MLMPHNRCRPANCRQRSTLENPPESAVQDRLSGVEGHQRGGGISKALRFSTPLIRGWRRSVERCLTFSLPSRDCLSNRRAWATRRAGVPGRLTRWQPLHSEHQGVDPPALWLTKPLWRGTPRTPGFWLSPRSWLLL